VLQICARSEPGLAIDTYLKIIEAKTAVLMATCCRTGALLGEAKRSQTEALTAFGRKVGLAFQIIDDILDYTGDEEVLGKPVGSDLREGKVTLPLIYALQRAGSADRECLAEALERPAALKTAEIAAVAAVIERYGGFEASRETAAGFVQDARRDLEAAPAGPPRDGLLYLAEKSVQRAA
jgi:octaprenyl-diphosphate synthase